MSARSPSLSREREKAESMDSSRNLPDSTSRMMRIEMALRRCPKLSPIGHVLQSPDPLFDRRVGAEERTNAAGAEGVHYEERSRGGVLVVHGIARHAGIELAQGPGEKEGISRQVRSAVIGQVLPGAGDGELDEHRGKGRDDGEDDDGEDIAAPVIIVGRAPEEGRKTGPVGDHGDGPRQCRGNTLYEDVAVLYVGELMGENTLEFVPREYAHDARRYRHHPVLGIAVKLWQRLGYSLCNV